MLLNVGPNSHSASDHTQANWNGFVGTLKLVATPPGAAFVAAAELGFYYYIECSSWANQGAQVGTGGPLDEWLIREGERVLRA
jgi:hypothetical protein